MSWNSKCTFFSCFVLYLSEIARNLVSQHGKMESILTCIDASSAELQTTAEVTLSWIQRDNQLQSA